MGETLGYQTELLRPDKFELYWPEIARQLDTVEHIWASWHTKDSIRLGVVSGAYDVWCVGPPEKVNFVVFTRIIDYDAARVLQGWLAFGNEVEKCLPNITATLEAFAHNTGCKRLEVVGRRGWTKVLKGFREEAVVLSRNLEHFKVQ